MAEAKKRARKKAEAVEPVETLVESLLTEAPKADDPDPVTPAPGATASGLPERIVVFTLDDQSYALPIDRVQEIQQIVALSSVPDPSPALVGMVNLRGLVVPAIDLRTVLGIPTLPYVLHTTMIITRASGHLVALVVDGVEDVVELDPDCVQPGSPMHSLADRMLGVCRMTDRLVFLLDIDRVLPAGALAVAPVAGEGEA